MLANPLTISLLILVPLLSGVAALMLRSDRPRRILLVSAASLHL
jgi:hypothetical protein